MAVNEAIIDVEIGIAKFEGKYNEGCMPVLGCHGCNQETMKYVPGAKKFKMGSFILVKYLITG